jgi:7-keto-8-aminopelargonate synthetase-like enzyme
MHLTDRSLPLPADSRSARPSLDELARDKLAALERRQLRRRLIVTARPDATTALQGDAELVSFSCNDYLGLSHHPEVVAASIEARAATARGRAHRGSSTATTLFTSSSSASSPR